MKSRSERIEARKRRRNQIFISVLIALLLVTSTIGFYFQGSTTTTRYNGHKIIAVTTETGQIVGYSTKINGEMMQFATAPQDSLAVHLPAGFIDQLRSAQAIIFLFDPTDNNTAIYDQIRFSMRTSIPIAQGSAITAQSDLYPTTPQASCADARAEAPILLLTHANRTITYENGCWVLGGEAVVDWIFLHDRIVYAYHGITQE